MPKAAAEGKTRKKKDPNAPKRAMSSYMFFSNERRPTLKEEQPDLPFGDYAKLIGEEWKQMDDADKKPYTDMAEKDKKRAERQGKTYEKKKAKGIEPKAKKKPTKKKPTKKKKPAQKK